VGKFKLRDIFFWITVICCTLALLADIFSCLPDNPKRAMIHLALWQYGGFAAILFMPTVRRIKKWWADRYKKKQRLLPFMGRRTT